MIHLLFLCHDVYIYKAHKIDYRKYHRNYRFFAFSVIDTSELSKFTLLE